MTGNDKKHPDCFGDLDTVFPMGGGDLRESPAACIECPYKTECLRKALESRGGEKVREEFVDRAYVSGRIRFLERWSRKKHLHRQANKKQKDHQR